MRWLTSRLQTAPFLAWSDEQIPGGSDWIHELEKEIASCVAFVVVLSGDSVSRDSFVHNEYLWALERGVPIVPVQISDCKPPLALARLHRIDFRSNWEEALPRLLQAIASNSLTSSRSKHATLPTRQKEQKAFVGDSLRFQDFLRPDPVSIEAAIQGFNAGTREFSMEWRGEQIELLNSARRKLDMAVDQEGRAVEFCGRSSDEIARFVSSCSSALREADRVLDHACERIPLLLEGMLKHWGTMGGRSNIAVENYLLIVAFRLQFEIAAGLLGTSVAARPNENLLRFLRVPKLPTPRAEDRWKAFVQAGEYASMQSLFDIKEPIWRAMVVRLGDQPFGDYVWAPRSQLLGAYKEASRGKMVTNGLFPRYLIPQAEFMSIGSATEYTYNETLTISKIKNEANVEINM